MSRDITLPAAKEDARIILKDPSSDLDRAFTLRTLTRSVKRQINDLQSEMAALPDAPKLPDDATAEQIAEFEKQSAEFREKRDEIEDQAVRLTCDLISLIVEPDTDVEGSPQAGDILYQAWVDEKITDDQITGLLKQLEPRAADPT